MKEHKPGSIYLRPSTTINDVIGYHLHDINGIFSTGLQCQPVSLIKVLKMDDIFGTTDFVVGPKNLPLSLRSPIRMMIFGLFFKSISPIFCMIVEDNRTHRLSKMVSLKKSLIWDYRGLSVQNRCCFFGFKSKQR